MISNVYIYTCVSIIISTFFFSICLFMQPKIQETSRTDVHHVSGHSSKFHRLNEGHLCSSVRDEVLVTLRISDLFCNITIRKIDNLHLSKHVSRISSSIFEIFNFKSHTHLVNTVVSQERRKVCIKGYSRTSFPKLSPVLIIVIQLALQHLSQVAQLILPDKGSDSIVSFY